MADKKDPKSPATTSSAYDEMLPRWAMMDALLGGTETMRLAGSAYLPQHEEESDNRYQERLATATLLNVTEETLEVLASKPFTEEMKLEDVPPAIEELFPDIDLQGNNVSVFARNWFREGLAKAFAHVLVEMPKPSPPAEGERRTLADDRREGVRPYWVMIKPENVLFLHTELVDGKEIPVHVRILECYTEREGFAEVHKKRIRVLEPGTVELWEPKKRKTAAEKEEWLLAGAWETGIDYIPFVTFYAARDGVACAKLPLQDLAYLNVTHWQSSSDQRHILTVTRFPILAASGASKDDGSITIGPNKVLYVEDPHGKYYYVEHTGAAIEAGQTDIEKIEQQMAMYGAEFLEEEPGNPTATAKAIDSANESSVLSSMAMRFEDSLAAALDFTARWLKLAEGSGGKVEVIKDYEPALTDQFGLDALANARAKRDISREAYLNGLIRRGVLPEDFDMDADAELIDDETSQMMTAAAALDLDPNAPPPAPPVPGQLPQPQVPAAKKPAAKKARKK